MKVKSEIWLLSLSIFVVVVNQLKNVSCDLQLTSPTTRASSSRGIRPNAYFLDITKRELVRRLARKIDRFVDFSSSENEENNKTKNESFVDAPWHDLKAVFDRPLKMDTKIYQKSHPKDGSIDSLELPESDEVIEEILDGDKNTGSQPPVKLSTPDFSNSPVIATEKVQNMQDEHSEIESTTEIAFGHVTLPSLTRMIDLAEQDESDVLNKTQPRRILNDLSNNEEIIGSNDIERLPNDKNLDNNDLAEAEILNSPAAQCGRNRFNNEIFLTERIIGGNSTVPGEVPWMVSIRLKHPHLGQVGHWCGGVLIGSNYVATASHCIVNPLFRLLEPAYWEVRLGKHNIRKKEPTERTYQVAKLFHIKHYRAYDNDLAILKLQEKVEFDDYIRPICLPWNEHPNFSNSECYVSGWGRSDLNKKETDVLLKVKATVYDNSECHKVYYPKFKIAIKKWHLCAGNKFGGEGTCHADSGSPLQCRIKNRWYLAGITSFGSNCAKLGFPDVYAKIPYFLSWIKDKMTNE